MPGSKATPNTPDRKLLTRPEVKAIYGLSAETLRDWERRGLIPKPIRLSAAQQSHARHWAHDIEACLAAFQAEPALAAAEPPAPPKPQKIERAVMMPVDIGTLVTPDAA